jgi:hypothetical protein
MANLARGIAVVVFSCAFSSALPLRGEAAIGLRCSDWLNARKWMQYDETTNQYVGARPQDARPIPKDVDEKVSLIVFYATGIVETYTLLDQNINKLAAIPSLRVPPTPSVPVFLSRIDQSCMAGLQKDLRDYDVLDLVSQENTLDATLRIGLVQEIASKFMEAGERTKDR